MKDTLQLHEIAGYLPYELKVMSEYSEVSEIDSIHWSLDGHLRTQLNLCVQKSPSRFRGANLEHIKPILRPMSDLNDSDLMKEWLKEHSIEKNIMGLQLATRDARCIDVLGYPLQFITDLYRNHFDIHNLIGRGLAIDINTLNNE